MSEVPLYVPHMFWRLSFTTVSSFRLSIVPLFRGSSRLESLILSYHSRFACECNKEESIDKKDDDVWASAPVLSPQRLSLL